MGDMGDTFNEHKQITKELKAKHGIECPGCKEKFPRAIPSKLLPGWKCRTCGYVDTRPRISENTKMSHETAEMLKKILESWRRDLEWGSHHLNNAASAKSAEIHPHLTTRLVALEREAIDAGLIEPPM